MCGEWAVFYHSYSAAALLYEVQAAVAAVLFRFKSSFAVMPRLLLKGFNDIPDAATLLTEVCPPCVKPWPSRIPCLPAVIGMSVKHGHHPVWDFDRDLVTRHYNSMKKKRKLSPKYVIWSRRIIRGVLEIRARIDLGEQRCVCRCRWPLAELTERMQSGIIALLVHARTAPFLLVCLQTTRVQ